MANRCLRLDQHDWLDVWHVLGSPDRTRLNLLRDLAANATRASSSGVPDLDRFRAELERSGLAEDLAEARRTIERRIGGAAVPVAENEKDGTDSTQPSETPKAPEQSEPKAEELMTTPTDAPTAPAHVEQPSGLLGVLAVSAAKDRTCKTHEAVRFELKAALLRAGRELEPEHPVVDVNCVTETGHVLFEVLGVGLNMYADLRSGAARLREINHILAMPADHLCLVLSGPMRPRTGRPPPSTTYSASTSCGARRSRRGPVRAPTSRWGRSTHSALLLPTTVVRGD